MIAVALFAALSYAVTSSNRSGSTSAAKEKAEAQAATVVQFGTSVAANVLRKKVINNVSETGWEPDYLYTGWGSPCGSKDCMIFDGIPWDTFFPANFFDPNAPGAGISINTARILGVGMDNKAEIVLVIFSLPRKVCEAINKKLGITNTYPLDAYSAAQYRDISSSNPVFPEPAVTGSGDIGDTVTELNGKRSMCVRDGTFGGARANYIHVLVER